jgi:hypothetical protein
MALAGIGQSYNPSTLNIWLKKNKGFLNGNTFVWESVSSLGLSYVGKISNKNIASSLAAGDVVILNVLNGAHWVLATSMSDSTIFVNDSQYNTLSYNLSDIVAGNSGLYKVTGGTDLQSAAHQLRAALRNA